MRKNKKLAKVLFAGALAATLAATTAAPTSMAAPDDSYIVFLPTEDGVEYSYDSEHMSEDYSTSDYTVLLYKPGETVSFQVTSEKEFTVEDALEGTEYADASILDNGVVAFVMPEVDLCCDFSEDEQEADTDGEDTDGEDTDEEDGESGTENGEPGTFRLKLGKGLSGSCDMVNVDDIEIEAGKEYKGTDMVDLVRITSEDGLEESPNVRVYKNGEKVEDTSDIIINQGLSKDTFVVDFKNGLSLENDSYTVKVSQKKGSSTEDETEQETSDESAEDATEGTEADTEEEAATEGSSEDEAVESVNAYFNPADITEAETETEPETSDETEAAVQDDAGQQAETIPEAQTEAVTETETETETMSSLGVVGDDYEEDSAVSSLVGGFADTVRETATAVNVTVTNNIPDLPLIVKKADGTIEAVNDASYAAEGGIMEIEFIGKMIYAPQIKVLKDGEEMEEEDSIIMDQEYLSNGNLFMEFKEGILPGNYEIQIG